MKCGLNSSLLLSFVDALNAAFEKQLPATLVLESGTVRAIAARLVKTGSVLAPVPAKFANTQHVVVLQSRVGRWAGASQVAQLVPLSTAGGDAILEVPVLRWSSADDVPPAARHGGFVSGAQRFDHGMFSTSPSEARHGTHTRT